MQSYSLTPTAGHTADLLDDAAACRHLLTNTRTLRLWRRTAGLPFIRVTARTLRYRRTDLDGWLDRRRVQVSA